MRKSLNVVYPFGCVTVALCLFTGPKSFEYLGHPAYKIANRRRGLVGPDDVSAHTPVYARMPFSGNGWCTTGAPSPAESRTPSLSTAIRPSDS